MEEDFIHLHDYVDHQNYKDAENFLRCMQNIFEKDYHETAIDEYILNAFDEKHGLIEFIKKSKNVKEFSDAIAESLEILHVFVNKMTNKVVKYTPEIRETCIRIALTNNLSSKTRTRALDLLSLVLQKTDNFSSDQSIQELYETLHNCFATCLNKKTSLVLAKTVKALYTLIRKYYNRLKSVDMLCKIILSHLQSNVRKSDSISETEEYFRFFDNYLYVNNNYDERKCLYEHVKSRLRVSSSVKTSHIAALEFMQHHADLYREEIYNDSEMWERELNTYLKCTGEIQKTAYYTLDVLYEVLGDTISNKNDRRSCKAYFAQFTHDINNEKKHGYELRLSIRGFGYFAKCFKMQLSKDTVTTSFLNMILRIERIYLLDFDKQSEQLGYLPDYVQTLSKIVEQLDDVSYHEIMILQKTVILLIRLSPHLSAHHSDFVVNPILVAFNLVRKFHRGASKDFLQNVIKEGIVYSCSHPIAYDLSDPDVITYKNYMKLWINLVNKNVNSLTVSLTNAEEMLEEIYDELIRVLLTLISRLNLNIQKVEERSAQSDPRISLEAVKIPDFNIFVNMIDLYVELLKAAPKTRFSKCVKRYFDFTINESQKYPLVSGFYKLIAAGLEICNSLNYFSPERLQRNDIKSYYDTINNFINSILIKIEIYKDDLKLSCIKIVLAAPELYVKTNLKRLSPAITSLFTSSRSNLKLAMVGVDTLDAWCQFLPQNVYDEFLMEVVPTLDSYLRSKALSEAIDTSTIKQRKRKQALYRRNVASVAEGDLLQLQKKILSFLGNLSRNVCRSITEVNSKIEQIPTGKNLFMKVDLSFSTKISIHVEKFLPRVIDLALYCSERKLQITACETLHAMVIIFLGTSRVCDQKDLDKQFKKMFYPVLQLGCFPDKTIQLLIKPLVDQLIHWYSSPSQRNSTKLGIVIESLLDAVTQRDDTSLRDFSCHCIHELIKYSLKHCTGRSDEEYSNIKIIIRKIKQFCYHSDPVKRLAGSLIFNNIYTLLREENVIIDTYWLELFQSLIYNLCQVEENNEYDSLFYAIQSIDHLERVFKEKATIFNKSSNKRKIPNGFLDGTLNSVITTALNYRFAKNRQAKARIYEFYYRVSPFTNNKSNNLVFSPYVLSGSIFRNLGDTNMSLTDLVTFLKKFIHILDTELSVYEHEKKKHCYEIDELLFQYVEEYFEKLHSHNLKAIVTINKVTDLDNRVFKHLKKCLVQYLIIASFYEEGNFKIDSLVQKYGIKLLLDFLFGNSDDVENLSEPIIINLLEKIINIDYVTLLVRHINEYIVNNHLIIGDLEKNVSRRQMLLLRGMKILSKSSFNEKLNVYVYVKDILQNVFNKLVSSITNYTIKMTADIKKYCQSLIELCVQQEDTTFLLSFICDQTEIKDIEKNSNTTFGLYIYNSFKDSLLPIMTTNFESFINLLRVRDDIYFFTEEILKHLSFNKSKLNSTLTIQVINTILLKWAMYERYYIRDLKSITQGLCLLESLSNLSNGMEISLKDDVISWILSCFDFSINRGIVFHLYKHIELILSALSVVPDQQTFDLFRENLDVVRNNYFTEITPELHNEATIAINKTFQTSIMAGSKELFIFSCSIYVTSKLRKDINIESYSKDFMLRVCNELQYETLKSIYQNSILEYTENSLKCINLIVSNLLRYAKHEVFEKFFIQFINEILQLLEKPDDTKEDILSKCMGYILIKSLFSRINIEKIEDKSCQITEMAYTITEGMELTKYLFKISTKYLVEKNSDSSEFIECVRICKCHCYNALISIISNGVKNHHSNYTLFYNKLFYREVDGENILWKNLIDLSKHYDFPLFFDKLPEKTTQLVNIRTQNEKTSNIHYIESQTLFNSTLREDFRNYDFTKTILRSQESEMMYTSNQTEVEMKITVEGDEINYHECMANICGLVKQIHDDKIYEGHQLPKWIEYINKDLKNDKTHTNVKLFLLKIIEKEQDIFIHFANILSQTIIDLIVNQVVGNGINYFVGDLIIMLTSWGYKKEVNIDNPTSISKLVLFLMENTNRERYDVKKYHLNLLKLVVETWKEYIEVPTDFIFSELEKLAKSKKVEVVIYFSSVFLANGLSPWGNNLKKYASRLVLCLQSDSSLVQRTCSETIAMSLKLAEESAHPDFNPFKQAVIKNVNSFALGKYLACVQGFMKTYPQICDNLLTKLTFDYCKTPESKRVALQVFSGRIEALHTHKNFPWIKFENLINNSDDGLNVLGMDIIKKSIVAVHIDEDLQQSTKIRFTKEDFISLMNSIAKFSNSNNRVCRSAMYDVFIEINNTLRNSEIQQFSLNILLQGLTDAENEIQIKLIEFFFNKLPSDNISSKFLSILKEMYKPELEDQFLGYTAKFLLEDLDTSIVLFDTPLQDSDFSERQLSDNWRGRHSSYAPLFALTYQSNDAFNTQGYSTNQTSTGGFNLRATAMQMEFEPTYQPGSIAFEKQEMLQSTEIGEDQEVIFKTPLPVDRKIHKKRFQRDTTKTHRQIALWQLNKKEKMTKDRLDNAKQRQEKATIYRKYRDGEIPDIEICLADLITPLSQLIQHDAHLAEVFYTSFFHEILHQNSDNQDYLNVISETINKIFKSSTVYNSYFMSALLNVVRNIPSQAFPPAIIATVASNSGLLSSGILVLEEYLISSHGESNEIPTKRSPVSNPELKIWVKLADLYRELEDWDMVKAIFLQKMDCNKDVEEALNYESHGQWQKAEDCYIKLLQTDLSLDRKDFYYESYFKCFAEMSKWQEMSNAIQKATSDNVWIDLWDKDWNQQKLLPWYMSAKVKSSTEDPTKMKEFTNLLNTALRDNEKGAYLKQHFSEEIGFIHLICDNLDKALYYVKNNLEKFLEDWQSTSQMLVSLRTNKLMKIMNTIDMFNFICKINVADKVVLRTNAIQIGNQWQRVTQENVSSIIPLETRNTYRIKCLSTLHDKLKDLDETWNKVKFDINLALLETALNMKNYHVARKYFRELDEDDERVRLPYAKMVLLRAKYLPDGSNELFSYIDGAYKAVEPLLDTSVSVDLKLSGANALYDILFDFAKSASQFEMEICNLIPDLKNCTEDGIKQYAVTTVQNILNTCSTQVSSSDLPLIADSYIKLTRFYESSTNYSEQLITSVLRSMYYGSKEGQQIFPCLLDIKDVGIKHKDLFLKELKNIPEWLFIRWIPQLLSKLDSDCIFIIDSVILKMAETYPQSITYSYKLSKEKYNRNIEDNTIRRYLDNLLKKLDQLLANETIDNIIEALSSVASAKNVIFFHITNLLHACLLNDVTLFNTYIENFNIFCKKVNTDDPSSKIGSVHKRIVELSKEIFKLQKDQFNPNKILEKLNVCKMNIKNVEDTDKRLARFKLKLSYYSPYLEYFMDHQLEDNIELEIPGQYKGDTKPLPQYHTKIAGFGSEVLPMKSIREPIKLKIIGNDGKDHPFLVKVGEDLRQDQRIEQMFSLMNDIFNTNAMCRDRRIKISTYQVIPLNANLGLIEWVENTLSLSQFLNENTSYDVEKYLDMARKRHRARYSFPGRLDHNKALRKHKPEVVSAIYQELVNMIPLDVFRKALMTLSVNSESFISIRTTFITSYVSTCIANWILGIGDRHLNNTLLCVENVRSVDIDFGHAFASGVQIQHIPELVPFRLTPHIVSLMQPLEEHGLIEQTMTHVLRALRENRNSLMSTVKVFINEPSMDWVQYKKLENQAMGFNWCGKEKIHHTEMKLTGASSAEIMIEELRKRTVDTECIEKYVEYVRGNERNIRFRLTGMLSVEDQVKCLLDHATDPNLLCRMYSGWDAWL